MVAELKAGAEKRDAEVAELRQDLAFTKAKVSKIEREVDDIATQVSKTCLIMWGKGMKSLLRLKLNIWVNVNYISIRYTSARL